MRQLFPYAKLHFRTKVYIDSKGNGVFMVTDRFFVMNIADILIFSFLINNPNLYLKSTLLTNEFLDNGISRRC